LGRPLGGREGSEKKDKRKERDALHSDGKKEKLLNLGKGEEE